MAALSSLDQQSLMGEHLSNSIERSIYSCNGLTYTGRFEPQSKRESLRNIHRCMDTPLFVEQVSGVTIINFIIMGIKADD